MIPLQQKEKFAYGCILHIYDNVKIDVCYTNIYAHPTHPFILLNLFYYIYIIYKKKKGLTKFL